MRRQQIAAVVALVVGAATVAVAVAVAVSEFPRGLGLMACVLVAGAAAWYAGRNVKQVASWLGHADPAFRLRTYVHLMDERLGDTDFLDAAVAQVNVGSTRGPQTAENDHGRQRALLAL